MQGTIAILEDDPCRVLIMGDCLAAMRARGRARWFRAAPVMIDWLAEHLDGLALISLDHDLLYATDPGGRQIDPGDGRDVANYLAGQRPACPVIIHSSNAPCAEAMALALTDAGWRITRVFPLAGHDWVET